MCANVPDLLSFAEYLVDSPAILTAMTRPNIRTGEGSWYGLGWHLADRQASVIWHRGAWNSYRSCLLLVPERRFVAVALANDTEGDPVIDDYLRARLGEATGLALPWGRPSWYPRNALRLALAWATRRLPI
jgi:CubicO group peptidase (beta-lactamase class C family)